MNIYSLSDCQDLIDKYVHELNGTATTIEEGCLGLGTIVLHDAPKKKTIIIREVFLNSWSSGHTIRMYNKTPKKYEQLLN